MNIVFVVLFIIIQFLLFCCVYLWTLAVASISSIKENNTAGEFLKFAVTIPAHNEERVIASTIQNLLRMDYPVSKFSIFVVADFCDDETAQNAKSVGALCFERNSGQRGGKSEALIWLFEKIFGSDKSYDAVVVFDADTLVDKDFLYHINNHMSKGTKVVQGKHIISNPEAGWYPALAWALMTIDNRFSNHGRHNLGLSAKHMGDSICFKKDVLEDLGWGTGLTEDFEFRLRLLLEGIKIEYEPRAIGYGQAPITWKAAEAQRRRWLKGVSDAGENYRWPLIKSGIINLDLAKFDGAVSASLPSYSTLTIFTMIVFILSLITDFSGLHLIRLFLGIILILWFLYPFVGLFLERAPFKSYFVILTGPIFMVWRTFLRIQTYFMGDKVSWVRTQHN